MSQQTPHERIIPTASHLPHYFPKALASAFIERHKSACTKDIWISFLHVNEWGRSLGMRVQCAHWDSELELLKSLDQAS